MQPELWARVISGVRVSSVVELWTSDERRSFDKHQWFSEWLGQWKLQLRLCVLQHQSRPTVYTTAHWPACLCRSQVCLLRPMYVHSCRYSLSLSLSLSLSYQQFLSFSGFLFCVFSLACISVCSCVSLSLCSSLHSPAYGPLCLKQMNEWVNEWINQSMIFQIF